MNIKGWYRYEYGWVLKNRSELLIFYLEIFVDFYDNIMVVNVILVCCGSVYSLMENGGSCLCKGFKW